MIVDDRWFLLASLSFDPLAPLVLSQGVDPLPHQLSALLGEVDAEHQCESPIPHKVGGLLRAPPPLRVLLADETGLGKTIISGEYMLSLMLRGLARNVIVVAPKSVVVQWQDEMLQKFGVYFEVISTSREIERLNSRDLNINSLRFVVSMDLIKGKAGIKFLEGLPAGALDLVIVDEAHHVISGGETLRLEAVRILVEKGQSVMFTSATPFRGDYKKEYQRVSSLLGDEFLYIRRFKDNVTDWQGRPIFPPRSSRVVVVRPSLYWFEVLDHIEQTILSLDVPILMKLVMLKRASSSIYALKHTLEKYTAANKLGENPFSLVSDDVGGKEPDSAPERTRRKPQKDKEFTHLLSLIDGALSKDELTYKEAEFLALIKQPTQRDKVVVFTEYVSTLKRLMEILERVGIEYVHIDGSCSLKERKHAISLFWRDPRVRVFLATDAAGEGINLQIARYQINYDIPWSPVKLEQRFGRIHRYGQKRPAILYNLAVSGTIDDRVITKVLKKLEAVSRLLGDWVYDYVGSSIQADELRKAVESLDPDVVSEDTMKYRLERIRRDIHSPTLSAPQEYCIKIERLRRMFSGEFKTNVTEALHITSLLMEGLQAKTVRPKGDIGIVVGVAFGGNREVLALRSLRVTSSSHLEDPLSGVVVPLDTAEQYLTQKLKELASFYGRDIKTISILDSTGLV